MTTAIAYFLRLGFDKPISLAIFLFEFGQFAFSGSWLAEQF